MTDFNDTLLESLRSIGLGPQRIKRAAEGETLFGSGGLLNSIEVVQFFAEVSECTGLDVFEFLESFQCEANAVVNIDSIGCLLESRDCQAVAG